MKIVNEIQGSEEWEKNRFNRYNASEAVWMLGITHHGMDRDDLIEYKTTGWTKESPNYFLQFLYNKGHEAEASARTLLECKLVEQIDPLVLVETTPELSRLPMACSLDGAVRNRPFGDSGLGDSGLGDSGLGIIWIFEHKLWNAELAEYIRQHDDIPEEYKPQVQQALMPELSGAQHCLFVCSDGTGNPERYVEALIVPDKELHQLIREGWDLFHKDLIARQKQKGTAKPISKQGLAPMELPAILIAIEGGVKSSNLPAIKSQALEVISAIPGREALEAIMDADEIEEFFANSKTTSKWLKDLEGKIDAAKTHALSQTSSIDEQFRLMDDIKATARAKRLDLEKLVDAEQVRRRRDIANQAHQSLGEYMTELEERLEGYIIKLQIAFTPASAMHGKRTIKSCQAAVDEKLTEIKLHANDMAKRMTDNLYQVKALFGKYRDIPGFPDMQELLSKPPDDFIAITRQRAADIQRERQESNRAQKDVAEERAHKIDPKDLLEIAHKIAPKDVLEAPLATMQGWKSIDTAPKDRRILLGYETNVWLTGNVVAGYWEEDGESKHPKPYWRSDLAALIGIKTSREVQPVVWMELPEYKAEENDESGT